MKEERIELSKEQMNEIKRFLKKENSNYTKEEIKRVLLFYKNKKV